ncbi:FAD-dependent monooxygenase, partial [Actinoplanes sp. NPDC026623]
PGAVGATAGARGRGPARGDGHPRRMSAVVQARGRLALRARNAALGSLRPRILGHARGLAADWQPPD